MHNLSHYIKKYFVLLLAVSKNKMMIQTVDKPNSTPVGQDRETLTFKTLLYLNVAVHAHSVDCFVWYISHCSAWLPHFNKYRIVVVNQIIHYNGVLAIIKTPP